MYEGVYRILFLLPTWLVAATLAMSIVVTLHGKKSHEYWLWAFSYVGLLMVVFTAIGILKRGPIFVPLYHLRFGWFHWTILATAISVGTVACLSVNENRLTEVFRDIIVDPLFVFLMLTLLPIVYANGTASDKMLTAVVLFWVVPSVVRMLLSLRRSIPEEAEMWRPQRPDQWFDS
jgi:hypothetical protein